MIESNKFGTKLWMRNYTILCQEMFVTLSGNVRNHIILVYFLRWY